MNKSYDPKRGETKIFEILRFPLICMVVLIHTLQCDKKVYIMQSWYGDVLYFIQEAICRSAVPVFFVISGYLFFHNITEFKKDIFLSKVRSRIHTLLVPYLLWNLIALTENLIKHLPMLSSIFPNIHKQIIDFNYFIGSFWIMPNGNGPILYPFWYIRDLMVLIVISPIIYYMLKKLRKFFLFLLLAGMFCEIKLLPGLSLSSMFFFSVGGYWALFKKNDSPNIFLVSSCLLCWIPIALADTITRIAYMHTLSVVCGAGAICCLGVIAKDIFHLSPKQTLQKTIFLVYAIHAILLEYISMTVFLALPSNSEWACLILHIVVFVLTMLSSILSYHLMTKYFPKASKVLTGRRI